MKIFESFFNLGSGVRLRFLDTQSAGPALIFANGLGGPTSVFWPYFEHLADRYRLIAWDYRGLYGSSAGPVPQDLSIARHADDLLALITHLGISSPILVGWSMGVQVSLEACRRNPEQIRGLVLICGTYGRPLEALPLPYSGRIVGDMIKLAQSASPRVERGLSLLLKHPPPLGLLKRMRLVAPGFDEALYRRVAADFGAIHLPSYLELLRQLDLHDAEPELSQITAPTLVVAAGRDRLTPSYLSRKLASSLPNAQLFLLPNATHYAAAEYPHEIMQRLVHFTEHEIAQGIVASSP